MTAWGIDIGTSNSAVVRYNPRTGRPEGVQLDDLQAPVDPNRPAGATPLIPSAVAFLEPTGWQSRIAHWAWVQKHTLWGKQALIGQAALQANGALPSPAYVPRFKPWLGPRSLEPLAKSSGQPRTARDAAATFLREIRRAAWRQHRETLSALTITAPVDAYETYRAEWRAIAASQGLPAPSFLDEPVAAALGYGIGLDKSRNVLVLDFGAGTLDVAWVKLHPADMKGGRAHIVAKAGRLLGGDHVDEWMVDEVLRSLRVRLDGDAFWRTQMRAEARRVKEATYLRDRELFHVVPPAASSWVQREDERIVFTANRLQALCQRQGLYRQLEGLLDQVLAEAHQRGGGDVDDVLMVGGSTLLPGVYPLVTSRFGRDRVRAFRPFDAVAWGAALYAGGSVATDDHLVHSYAILTREGEQHAERYVPVIEAGTRFPTAPDHWRMHLTPACALGTPEAIFKLVICELGPVQDDPGLYAWDDRGNVYTPKDGAPRRVVPLNAHAPTLGTLNPPHAPGDDSARLDVQLGVNSDRWLIATVIDLQTGQRLFDGKPVVRLL